ncbi:type 2 lantipeptide synthetase LanM [[Ruminococcus] gnavus]|uniref:Type 2 lantipeptide synthetase LanM n=1 Tax=Mediterraneibacter gnavus TaxID=33038 RepID=A0AAJ1AWM4_MEDGN|nr:type 2 lanthipeptide synthetase LanM [Mediterraneibacter gnavus]MCB5493676.1 type 2 lantipeptide synthetase LanM [Mediterraneibacter gnavus]MCB5592902.1 type 2 lantipeptide synthetase LanM [Mediterraneibacter gnavus]MCB5605643.1 type 2 lantipeptide synthetase LanM [Mediterraneibacter gnavus]MCG4523823.1 type 2 lanthipeptide synthetase LanM [Mediterraneibacter gnavus]NSC90048.1 type 2 lantipeptide synthetase LanM [Mediterraneibacter gnavus]
MDISVFNRFFEKNIEMFCIDEMQALKNKVDNNYFKSVYRNLILSIGQDMVRTLLPEFNLFVDGRNEGKRLSEFCEYILTDDFFDYFYKKYKMLKGKIIRKIEDILNYSGEIYDNFIKDRQKLEEIFGCSIGNITDIRLGNGDLHDGKTACRVETESLVLYYKPVNGNSISLFYKVIDFVIERESIQDKRLKYIACDNYVWMEEVKYKNCSSIDEVKQYFYISGIYLFVFYILNSFDMHHENIINYGSTPVVIDFETMTLLSTNKMKADKFKESVSSVLNTLFIPFINDGGALDVNVSGILSDTCKSEKEYYEYSFSEIEGIVAEKKKVEVIIDSQVKLNGKNVLYNYISLEEVRKLLHKGFEIAAGHVIKQKELLKKIILEYLSTNYIEFRQLLRPTEVYANFVFATYHPESLMSQKNTDKILMILENNFKPSSFGYLRVEKEIEDIKRGYIPKFYSCYDSKDLYSNGEIICNNYFCDTVKEKIEGKINSLDYETVEYQKKLIDLSLLILLKQKDFGKTDIKTFVPCEIDSNYVKRCVKELIKYFEQMEIRFVEHEVSTFLAPHLAVKDGMWRIREIDSSLYEYGGIVLVCAYYGKLYNEYNKIDFAIRIMDYLNSLIDHKNLSVFNGLGSLVYLNKKMYNLLENMPKYEKKIRIFKQNYKHYAEAILDKMLDNEIKDEEFDFIQGGGSSIYLLCKMYSKGEEKDTVFDKLQKVKNRIFEKFNGCRINDIGYAHGITGCLVILSEIYHMFPDLNIRNKIEDLIDKENQMIEAIGISNLPSTWCRGTSGILLGRDIIFKNMCHDSEESKELGNKIRKFEQELNSNEIIQKMLSVENLCMCHGIYGNIEILMYLKKDNKYKKEIYTSRFESFSKINWLNNMIDVPINNFMLGNAGVAYVLLEMISDKVSNFLTLEI